MIPTPQTPVTLTPPFLLCLPQGHWFLRAAIGEVYLGFVNLQLYKILKSITQFDFSFCKHPPFLRLKFRSLNIVGFHHCNLPSQIWPLHVQDNQSFCCLFFATWRRWFCFANALQLLFFCTFWFIFSHILQKCCSASSFAPKMVKRGRRIYWWSPWIWGNWRRILE